MNEKEFKRVILEIAECLKEGAITPTFQKLIEIYEEDVKGENEK